jgi:hypothetical protein
MTVSMPVSIVVVTDGAVAGLVVVVLLVPPPSSGTGGEAITRVVTIGRYLAGSRAALRSVIA